MECYTMDGRMTHGSIKFKRKLARKVCTDIEQTQTGSHPSSSRGCEPACMGAHTFNKVSSKFMNVESVCVRRTKKFQ